MERSLTFQSPNRLENPRRDDPDSMCRVRLYPFEFGFSGEDGKKHLVLVTEVAENPGMSITNSWEVLGPQITKFFDLEPGSIRPIERYGPYSYPQQDAEERLSLVIYDVAEDGRWTNIRWEPVGDLEEVTA